MQYIPQTFFMVDELHQGEGQTPHQEGEVKVENDIFKRDLSGPLKNGLARTMGKMWNSRTQYRDYYTTTSTGVDIQLETQGTRSVPGTTPDTITARLRDGSRRRTVEGVVRVTGTHEPVLNLSSYEAAPIYPEKATITALQDKRTVDLDGGIRVTKGFGIRNNQGEPVVSEGPLRIIVPLSESLIVQGETVNIVIDWEGEEIDVEPNAVVYEKRQFERGGDSWTKTYVEQEVDKRGRRGAISYPRSDGYIDGNYKVMDLELADNERELVGTILDQVGNIEEPPIFNNVFDVDIEKTDPKYLSEKR